MILTISPILLSIFVTVIFAALWPPPILAAAVVIPATYIVLPIPNALPAFMMVIAVIPPLCLSTVTFAVACLPVVVPTPTAFSTPSTPNVGTPSSSEFNNCALKYISSLAPPVPYPEPLLAILTFCIPLNP